MPPACVTSQSFSQGVLRPVLAAGTVLESTAGTFLRLRSDLYRPFSLPFVYVPFIFIFPSLRLSSARTNALGFSRIDKKMILTQMTRLSMYRQGNLSDFDKCTALSMAEPLAFDAMQVNHSKASVLAVCFPNVAKSQEV